MRVIVCGGRDYADRTRLYQALDALHMAEPIMCLIHGGARGADTLAGYWARERDVPVCVFYADWETHGRSAGAIRNRKMHRESDPDVVVAFPGGTGTANMIRVAEAAGTLVLRP